MQLYSSQISTIWKRSYKGVEWKPCVNKSTGGIIIHRLFKSVLVLCNSNPTLFDAKTTSLVKLCTKNRVTQALGHNQLCLLFSSVLIIVVLPESNGFIFIEANGGLNQQRTSVSLSIL